jgi:hypothetical protein
MDLCKARVGGGNGHLVSTATTDSAPKPDRGRRRHAPTPRAHPRRCFPVNQSRVRLMLILPLYIRLPNNYRINNSKQGICFSFRVTAGMPHSTCKQRIVCAFLKRRAIEFKQAAVTTRKPTWLFSYSTTDHVEVVPPPRAKEYLSIEEILNL